VEQLVVNNRVINKDIMEILKDVQHEISNGKLSSIKKSGPDIAVTCPFHKDGMENRPSCYVNISNEDLEPGWFHCFTCGESGPLYKFIGECFNKDDNFGKQWLVKNYGNDFVKRTISLPKIELNKKEEVGETILDESVLSRMESYHPYMKQRKLSDEVISEFEIKYDPETQSLVFPVRDAKGNLIGLARRNVNYKRFDLPKFNNKPVYLLNKIVKDNIKKVVVCESQINALYLWSLGIPAVALFGTGSKFQYDLLNKTGIRFYTLCFDGDEAGSKGVKRFRDNIRKDCLIDVIEMPQGKDINDFDPDVVKKLFEVE
jgi:DNA primase